MIEAESAACVSYVNMLAHVMIPTIVGGVGGVLSYTRAPDVGFMERIGVIFAMVGAVWSVSTALFVVLH